MHGKHEVVGSNPTRADFLYGIEKPYIYIYIISVTISLPFSRVNFELDINPFHATDLRGFLMFSGGIKRDQCHEMG